MDIPAILNHIRPDAAWRWSGGYVTEDAGVYDYLLWEDAEQTPPSVEELEAAWQSMQAEAAQLEHARHLQVAEIEAVTDAQAQELLAQVESDLEALASANAERLPEIIRHMLQRQQRMLKALRHLTASGFINTAAEVE